MTPRPALSPQIAAKALAAWWELAGLEPVDVDSAIRASQKSKANSPTTTGAGAISPRSHDGQSASPAKAASTRAIATATRKPTDALNDAQILAAACSSLDALEKAIAAFDGCGLKTHARNTVFGDGMRGAPIMLIGEAPDRHDDETGKSFSGPSGVLLDKMLASIGLSRAKNCYLTNMIPWRPPGDRKPTQEEVAICKPFLERHIALAAPKAILFVGGASAQTLLATNDSVMKLRARSFKYGPEGEIYAQCLLSPAYLLNRPSEKALAWKDLLRFEGEISAIGVAK